MTTTDEYVHRAIESEVAWHVAGLDILGVPWERAGALWRRTAPSTNVFLTAMSLDRRVTAEQLAASVASVHGDVGVLDSFDSLDLSVFGYRKLWTEPWMLRRAGPFGSFGAPPPGFTVTRAIGPDEIAAFKETVFRGMNDDWDEAWRGTVHPPTTGQFDTLRLLLGRANDEPVTAGLAVPFADGVLVSGIATPAPLRRRGYGAAITRAVCETQPGDDAYLRASAMGRPVYERLGFVALGSATLWIRGGSSPSPVLTDGS